MRAIYIVCIVALLGAMMVIPASATTWDVHEGESIQAVINNASDYDTIIVYPGTYSGVTVNKRLTLEGIDHPVIRGGTYAGIYIKADGTVVRGFKVSSGGIMGYENNDVLIEDNICEGNGIILYASFSRHVSGQPDYIVRRNIVSAAGEGFGGCIEGGCSFFVYLNDFINGTNNAKDPGQYCTAHSPEKVTYVYEGNTYTNYMGNYWEAYTGVDADGDGIGDTPHMIYKSPYSWNPNSYDYYPLIQPFANYAVLEAQPDLSVQLITTSDTTYTDTPTMVTATISNTGIEDAAAFAVTLYADDTLVETETVDSLTVETTTNVIFRWTPTAVGDITLKVVADAADVIAELDEANNELTKGVTVKKSFSWPQFQRDAMCTGKTNSIAPTANVAVLWSRFTHYNTTHGIDVTPIVANGKAFVIDVDEYAWAFDAATGEPLWNTSLAQGPGFTLATPAYAAGKVFFATSTGYIYALDESNGTIIWSGELTEGQNEGLSTQICYDDGKIYVGSLEGKYYCLEASGNGTEPKILWSETLANGGFDWWSKGTIIGDFFVYGNTNAVIKSVYKENGTLIDEIDLSMEYGVDAKSIRSGIVYDEGHIYLTSTGGYIYSIGFNAGAGTFGSGIGNTYIGRTTSTPVIYDGMVYAGSENGTFYALHASTGTAAWEHTPNGAVSSSPVISIQDGKPYIYFTTNCTNGTVYCLNKDGNEMWSYEADHPAYMLQGVAIANEKVYFGNDAGWLYCLEEKTLPPEVWAQFHKDAKHTGFSNSTAPDTNDTLWVSDNIGAVPGSSTVVAEGKVFAKCGDSIKALNEYTGNILWSVPIPSSGLGSWHSPSYHDGCVFITAGTDVYCRYAADGSEKWTWAIPSGHESCNGGTTVADGKVVVGDWDGKHYYCIDEETTELLWTFTETNTGSWETAYAQGTPAYVDGKFYLTTWIYPGGHVYCVDADTGAELWNQTTPLDTCGSPTVANGVVYVTTYAFYGDGDLYAMNADTGEILWRKTIQRTDSTPAVAYGNVYVTSGCSGYSPVQTYCFNATTGDLIWNTMESDGIGGWTCSVAVADGKVFVGKPGDFFGYAGTYALDAFTGEVIWSYSNGGSSPAVVDGMVFTIGNGKVYAFYTTTKPDIIPTSLQPTTLHLNQSSTLTATILNNGGGNASAFNVSLKLGEALIGTKTVDALNIDEEKSIDFAWTPTSPGTFNLTVTVDTENVIDEFDETNNVMVKTVTIPQPDLIPTSLQPTTLHLNQPGTLTATIRNDGGENASSFNVSLKLGEALIGTKMVDALNISEEKTVDFTWTPTSTGTFNLTVTADTENVIDEFDETNNAMTVMVKVERASTPFLISGEVNYDNGDAASNLFVTVTNPGTSEEFTVKTVAGSNFYLTLTDSDHVSIDDTIRINVTDGINSNETSHTVTANDMNSGGFGEDLALASAPDLAITKISLKTPGYANEENVLCVGVKNIGCADAGSFNVSLLVNGTLMGEQTVLSLAVGENKTVEFEWIPEAAGNYTLKVTADSGGVIDELDESNNELTKDVEVILPAGVTFDLKKLDLNSNGILKAFITLPEGYDVADIDVSTVECEGAHAFGGGSVIPGKQALEVKFKIQDLVDVPTGDAVSLSVTGELTTGERFEGSNTVEVTAKGA